jgi:putative ABC transport system substrate-binding protein
VAISQTARIFSRKLSSVDMVVMSYDNDEAQARAAVDWADHNGFDLILAMGSEATAWMWSNYRGPLPVVSICAKDPVVLGQAKSYNEGTGTNFALTSLNLPPDVQMAFALELKPRLRNLAIIVDSQNVSAVETQAAPIADRAQARGIRVLRLNVQDPNHAAEELDQLVNNAVNAMRLNDPNLDDSLFLITGSTAVFREMETINARASRVPVISMVPETVHAGTDTAVLSIGVSFRSNAHLAAIYATSILEGGVRAGDLKVGVVTPPDVAINFRRAREIGLKVPFAFFESANVIFNYADQPVKSVSGSEK